MTTEKYISAETAGKMPYLNADTFEPSAVMMRTVSVGDKELDRELQDHGLTLEGWYHLSGQQQFDEDVPFDPVFGEDLPIVSFEYFKNGELQRRYLIWDGEGFGVHENHEGQDKAQYLTGCALTVTGRGLEAQYSLPFDESLGRRNFSMDCIMYGDRGDNPVDAATGQPMQ